MAINKYLLVSILLIINVLGAISQEDKKYLEGAVPVVDGKVLLSRDVKVNTAISQEQLFKLADEWANKEFEQIDESARRVLLSQEDENYIVSQGDEFLVFKKALLMIDQSRIIYQLVVRVGTSKLRLEMKNIRYEYQDYKDIVPAEKIITDKFALHKSGEKLNRHYDKFRTFTIDRLDELQQGLITYIEKSINLPQAVPPIQVEGSPAITVAQPMPVLAPTDAMAGYKKMEASDISASIIDMFKENWAVVTFGAGDDAKSAPAAWTGMGQMGGKSNSMVVLKSANNKDEKYTISFYSPIHKAELDKLEKGEKTKLTPLVTPSGASAYSEAWMIIECKKVLESEATSEILNDIQSKKWDKNDFDKLFIGEIVNIWAR